jgi:glycosyltransferase involved in cell wall biosynthesis
MALLSRRVKLVCSLRSADPVWIRANTRVLRFASRRVHCCVSNSQRALDIARELLVQRMPPGFVLHNALEDPFPEAAPIPRPDRILRVAMLGNILRHPKGYDDLVRLAALVRDRGLPIRFTVAGRPDEGDWFRSALREAQVEEIVNYVGPVADPVAFLKAHHAYLLLSRVEGCPNALLEAMSVGLPCVATRVGDLPAIVEAGRQLQLVEVSDIAAVLARLQDFLTDWPAAVTLGQAGRKWCFEHFSTAALTAACTDLARWVETH